MKNLFKKLRIPSGETTTVVAYNSWVVRWKSCNGIFPRDWKNEIEIFPSKIDAENFAKQLMESAKFLKCSVPVFDISVEANQSKLATLIE